MLQDSFSKVYTKFKMHFYQKMFEKLQERETSLTTVETFCMEIIYALDKPTVAQFADMANISSPNAAYKINNLVKKGYLKKVQSEEDKREYHLEVTQKYIDYYNISNIIYNRSNIFISINSCKRNIFTIYSIYNYISICNCMLKYINKTKRNEWGYNSIFCNNGITIYNLYNIYKHKIKKNL